MGRHVFTQIIIRHGDRSPLTSLNPAEDAFWATQLPSSSNKEAAATSNPASPVDWLAEHPWIGKGVAGQLTVKGRKQMEAIGAKLRADLVKVNCSPHPHIKLTQGSWVQEYGVLPSTLGRADSEGRRPDPTSALHDESELSLSHCGRYLQLSR
jgi:hypothetical protein